MKKLVRVGSDELGEPGVASTELLKNRLQHLGLLLNDLPKLLELRIMSEKIQIAQLAAGLAAGLATGGCG